MDFLLTTAILVFVAISFCFLHLIKRQNRKAATYERRNIRGAARGHLGMFCPKSTVEKKRKALLRANTKF